MYVIGLYSTTSQFLSVGEVFIWLILSFILNFRAGTVSGVPVYVNYGSVEVNYKAQSAVFNFLAICRG